MRNLKLTLAYDGTEFNGWQTQPGLRTVQETLETTLANITGAKPFCNASGRTDAGVHAAGQVVNFFTETRLSANRLLLALNARLPPDVSIISCEEAEPSFNACQDAIKKLYRFVILDSVVRSPFMYRYALQSRHRLDAEKMHRAIQCLKGRHDFRCFETEYPNRASSVRTMLHVSVNRVGDYIWIDTEGDGFLYNMVRAIAGTLMNIGRGYWPEEYMQTILESQDRNLAGPTAAPHGLFLMRVTY